MELVGSAYCYGAATIINGIATGKGAAYGIGLKTSAKVILTEDVGNYNVTIEGDESENPVLAQFCARAVLKKFGLESKYGAEIITNSDIPISRGLKSSSAAANAIILATLQALGKELSDLDIINLGIDAAFEAEVTITGAFDDACATYFGNVVVTDNLNRKILAQYPIIENYEVIIHVPSEKIKKMDLDTTVLEGIKPDLEIAHDLALKMNFLKAIRINGLTYGTAMGLDTSVTQKALEAGAVTAGITGTGPATVILTKVSKKDDILSAIKSNAQIICTTINRKKAAILK